MSAVEQQGIADTINTILGAKPEDIPTLNPHPYNNFPHKITNAHLPTDVGSYMIYYMRSPNSPPGTARLIISDDGHIYYTNNHYRSFYPVDIRVKANGK